MRRDERKSITAKPSTRATRRARSAGGGSDARPPRSVDVEEHTRPPIERERMHELARAQEELRRARRQVDALITRQRTMQEDERKALAMELHDQLGQAVTGLSVMLEAARRHALGTPAEQPVQQAIDVASNLGATIRDILRRLRPQQLDLLGLTAAVRAHIDQIRSALHPQVRFSENIGDQRFAPVLELGCFRVVQEALSNVIRHARARSVDISLARRGQHLLLSVHDDGTGFDAEAVLRNLVDLGSLGLLGMRERVVTLGGDFHIDSRPGAGTDVLASFPLQ